MSWLFPKALQDPAPLGMKRIDFESLPDQRVETEREAALLPGDKGDAALLRPLLAGTQLEADALALAYDAAADGWDHRAFHARVDGRGPAVVLAETEGGATVGAYNPEGWVGLGEDRASNGAFLFAFVPSGGSGGKGSGSGGGKRGVKLPKIGGPNLAVIDNPGTGPQFGADGLAIPLKAVPKGDERLAKTKLGTYYARAPYGGGRSLWDGAGGDADAKRAYLKSLRVYVSAAGPPQWTLDAGSITWRSSK